MALTRTEQDPGDLNHRIVIQYKVETEDDFGQAKIDWFPFHACWAAFRGMSSMEYWQAQQVQAGASTEVVIRFVEGVKADMRVMEPSTGRILQIAGPPIDLMGRKFWLRIPCKE